MIAVICALLYRNATVRRLDYTASLKGGIPAAVMLEATPLVAGYYTRAVAGRTPVQVFLVLAGLLFTCYLIAVGLLVGAGLACTFQRATDLAKPGGWIIGFAGNGRPLVRQRPDTKRGADELTDAGGAHQSSDDLQTSRCRKPSTGTGLPEVS